MNRRNERQKGFTLIELLVVLIIFAVLATVLVPALTSYVDDAREKKAVSEAQVCVTAATEWAAVQRTALIAQAYQSNKSFADAYNAAADTAKWSTTHEELNTAAPTVTGTLALAEGDGQYFLRPEITPDTDTTTDAMKTTVKTAAGVGGTLQKLQLNADGKVLYLLYTSAEGIPVAYTAAGTAQDPATTVPVATLPQDTTPPKPTEPDHSGDLVFCVKDEYTGNAVPGIAFHLVDDKGNKVFGSQKTDEKGMVYFDLDPATLTHYQKFKLVPDNWPAGFQQVFDVEFDILAEKSNNEWDAPFDSYKIGANPVNTNQGIYNYKYGTVGTLTDGATDHLYTFYVRPVPTLELCVWDDDNGNYLNGVEFTLNKDGQSIPITSGLSPTELDVKLHEKDNLRRGRDYLYMPYKPNDSTNASLLVKFTNCPEGYQYFDNCNITIDLRNENGHNSQLYTEFQKGQSRTDIKCENQFNNNKCIVTIHVKGGKKVNFFVYDGLDSEHTTQLPNATMELYDKNNAKIATFITDKDGKPTGAGNFTKTLSVGEYTLKLTSGKPNDYSHPAPITFKVERGADGLLTLTGTGSSASCVDNANSTVTMLVTKPNTMRFKLRIVDYNDGAKNNDPQWAGVNVRLTGDALDTSFNNQRAYAINSIADNEHTFDITNANSNKTVTVTIVDGTDDGYDKNNHNQNYADNFVKSKFEFKLTKNSDGTFTLTPTNNNSARDGYIIGDTVYVYAYPKVTFDYECYPTHGFDSVFGQGTLTVDSYPNGKSVYTVFINSKDTTHSTIQPWKMARNHNHPEGVPLGSYELKNAETHPLTVFKPDSTAPWYFTVTQDQNGFPVIKDKNGTITKTITAKYTYLPTGS